MNEYSTDKGKYLVVTMNCSESKCIAEITQTEPLVVKIEEHGFCSNINQINFRIHDHDSSLVQKSPNELEKYIDNLRKNGEHLYSGLHSLGIEDGMLRDLTAFPKKEVALNA